MREQNRNIYLAYGNIKINIYKKNIMNLTQLESQINDIIKDDNFDINKLKEILSPISQYVDSPTFITNITTVVTIITQDRDGNKSFDVNDLKLLSEDPVAISSLFSAIIVIICAIPDLKLQYNKGNTEELILKLLAFIFLVIVPTQAKMPLTQATKTEIVSIIIKICSTMESSQLVATLATKIIAWFKTNNACACFQPGETKQETLDKKFPMIKLNLEHSMNNLRQKAIKEKELKILKEKEIKAKEFMEKNIKGESFNKTYIKR